jgi:histidine triad (HIT) family protein
MSECEYCGSVKRKVFENNSFVAFLKERPAVAGHILLVPKQHFTILEQVPEDVCGEMFHVANILSSILFEALGAEGTNILINNGSDSGQKVPHVAVNIIPRKEGDNLHLEWKPKQQDKEEMGVVELKLKEACKNIIVGKKEEKPKEIKEKKEEIKNSKWVEKILTRLP